MKLNKTITCADGFRMSVQASASAYSTPRNNEGPYETAEIGFPSEEETLIMEYAEDRNNPTNTVYAYVPSSVVALCVQNMAALLTEIFLKAFLF